MVLKGVGLEQEDMELEQEDMELEQEDMRHHMAEVLT